MYTTAAVFSKLHDQLASLERHGYLTRCSSAVAELLVLMMLSAWWSSSSVQLKSLSCDCLEHESEDFRTVQCCILHTHEQFLGPAVLD